MRGTLVVKGLTHITHFRPICHFNTLWKLQNTPLRTSESFSDVCRERINGTLPWNGRSRSVFRWRRNQSNYLHVDQWTVFYLMRAPLSNGSMNLYNVTTNKYTCCKSYQNTVKIETYIGKYVLFVPSFWCHSYFFNFNSLISLSLVVSCLFVFCLFFIHLYFLRYWN